MSNNWVYFDSWFNSSTFSKFYTTKNTPYIYTMGSSKPLSMTEARMCGIADQSR